MIKTIDTQARGWEIKGSNDNYSKARNTFFFFLEREQLQLQSNHLVPHLQVFQKKLGFICLHLAGVPTMIYLFKERIVKGMWTQPPEQIHKSLKLLCDFVQITWKCNFIQMYTLLKIHTWMYTDTHTHTQGTWLRDEEKLTWLVYKTVKPGLWVLWGLRTMFSCLMFPDHFLHVCFGFEFGI